VIVAQGTEGGGHVGLMASIVMVPVVAGAVASVPVLAAGGFADGAGLAAALALGAEGTDASCAIGSSSAGPRGRAGCGLVGKSCWHRRSGRAQGDTEEAVVWSGQSAALVDHVEPAGVVVERIVREAEEILRDRAGLVRAQCSC
jgi:NAD(P)H-dependent flavin oxidoreductase YrpB (nitropropane dioxygenase family)